MVSERKRGVNRAIGSGKGLRAISLLAGEWPTKAMTGRGGSLDGGFVDGGIFPTAAARGCMDRVSVPSLGIALSRPLAVIALVSHYLAN